MISEELWHAAANLLATAGLREEFHLQQLAGGANNRVFRVDMPGACVLLKAYFQHAADPRNRLGTEFAFASFAWENGVRVLPRPLACDSQHRLGLYEFVPGRQLLPQEVTPALVRQALDFYRHLNRCRWLPGACALPQASEACFSIADHLRCVERRLHKLRGMEHASQVQSMAARFVQDELSAVWRGVADAVRRQASELGLPLENAIASQDRCLSPSDFGFHNAILSGDHLLRFIDFEYAGWDDPGKMVCDFFCQPAVPVPLDYYDMFVEAVVSDLSEPELHAQRMALLLPVYRVKWCCIMLNDFLPTGRARRHFARSDVEQEERYAAQLDKVRCALQSLL
jgi:thiamine kinase-like enzyme